MSVYWGWTDGGWTLGGEAHSIVNVEWTGNWESNIVM